MDKYCLYCSSGLFEYDRNCPRCGAPTKQSDLVSVLIPKPKDKNFIVAVAECEGIDDLDCLLFKGKTLLDNSVKQEHSNYGFGNYFYSNIFPEIEIVDVKWFCEGWSYILLFPFYILF